MLLQAQYSLIGLAMLLSQRLFIKKRGSQVAHYERISDMLATGEVARLFNVHPGTVRRWSNQGIIKAYRIGPRGERRFRRDNTAIFFLEKAVQKYLKRG